MKIIIFVLSFIHLLSGVCLAQENTLSDFIPDVTYEEMEDRLSCLENEIPLSFNSRVQSFIDYFSVRNRNCTKEIISNQSVFFPIFEQQLAKYGLPDELKYLSIIESGLNPNAISRAGAGGLWQFMPATGKSFGLSQSWYIDERMNPWKSTEAACKYLKSLYSMFGDWELALAAYNTGPGNVRKAIRRSGYKKSFWEIYRYLPRETRGYVPQFVAMIYTLHYAEEHNFVLDDLDENHLPKYDTLQVDHYVHLNTLGDQISVCHEDMIRLNPQIIRGATPDGLVDYPIKIPVEQIEFARTHRNEVLDTASKVGKKELQALAKNSTGSTYGRKKVVYRVRSGDVLGTIAERYHVRISDIRSWNQLRGNMIYVGQRLNIWVLPHYSTVASKQTSKPKKPAKTVLIEGGKYHVVQEGDSLWSISKLYEDMSIEKLKKLNNLNTSRIDPGQKLLISL